MKTAIIDVLNEKIIITERGQPREITIGEGIITRLAAKALNGDVRSAHLLMDKWISFSPEVIEPQDNPVLNITLNGVRVPDSFAIRDGNLLPDGQDETDDDSDDGSNQ